MPASFRFYGVLNDFLPPSHRRATLTRSVMQRASIKDMIEAFGVPHPEIDRLVVNGELVDIRYVVRDGDRIAVYPTFHTLNLGDDGQLVPAMPGGVRFVADIHLRRHVSFATAAADQR